MTTAQCINKFNAHLSTHGLESLMRCVNTARVFNTQVGRSNYHIDEALAYVLRWDNRY